MPQLDFDPMLDADAPAKRTNFSGVDFDPWSDGPKADARRALPAPPGSRALTRPGFGETFAGAVKRGGAGAIASTAHAVADAVDQTVQAPLRRVTGALFGAGKVADAFTDPLGARIAADTNLGVQREITADRVASAERIGDRPTLQDWKATPGEATRRTALRLTSAAGESVPLLAAAVATRNPTAGAALMGSASATQEYTHLRSDGIGRADAAQAAALTGAIEAAGEGVSLPLVMGKTGRGSLTRAALVEGAQEAPVSVAQQNVDDQARGRETPVVDQLLDALDAAVVGSALGAGGHLVGAKRGDAVQQGAPRPEAPTGVALPLGGDLDPGAFPVEQVERGAHPASATLAAAVPGSMADATGMLPSTSASGGIPGDKNLTFPNNSDAPANTKNLTFPYIGEDATGDLQANLSQSSGRAAGVPVMITQRMRADLEVKGYTPEQIGRFTPDQAWNALALTPATPADVARAEAATLRATSQGPLSRIGADILDQRADVMEAQQVGNSEPGAIDRGRPEGLALRGSPGSGPSLAGILSPGNGGSMAAPPDPGNPSIRQRVPKPVLDFDPLTDDAPARRQAGTGQLDLDPVEALQGRRVEPGAVDRGRSNELPLDVRGSPGSVSTLAGMLPADNAGSIPTTPVDSPIRTRAGYPALDFDPTRDPLEAPSRIERVFGQSPAQPALDFDPSTSPVRAAAAQAATSPDNRLPMPSPAQIEAGHFKMGRIRINGLDVSIEHPAGVKRKPEHSQPLSHAYGFFRRTEGADGEKVDVFLSDRADDTSLPVFVVDQYKKDGSFDETKVMMGFDTEADARAGYLSNYPKGWEQTGLGGIRQMSQDKFKDWVRDSKATRKPAAAAAIHPKGLDFDPHLDAPAAPGLPREHAERLVRRFAKAWTNGPQVVLVDGAEALHRNAGVASGRDGARAEGLYNGKPAVFINTAAIDSPKRFRQVLAHEALGHFGVEQVVGDAWPGIAKNINRHIENNTGAPWMRRAIAQAQASQPDVSDPLHLAKEVLAVLAETGSKNNLVQTVIARTRATLRRAIPSVKWADADVRGLLSQAEGYLRKRPAAGSLQAFDFEGDQAVSQAAAGKSTGAGAFYSKPGEAPPETAHVAQQFGHVTDPQREALGKIATFQRQETIPERASRLSENLRAKVIQGTVDQFHAFKDLDPIAYMQARLSKGTDGAVEGVFKYGLPKLTDGALDITGDGKGFLGHLQALGGEHDLFLAWVAGHRSEQLAGEGREHLFTPDDIASLKNLNKGHMMNGRSREAVYRSALQGLNRYQKAILDIAEEAGEINAASRERWQTDFYLPFFRDMDGSPASTPLRTRGGDNPGDIAEMRKQVIERLVGGGQPLNDLLENILQNWGRLLSASMKNLAATRALKAAVEIGVAKPVPTAERGTVSAMFHGERKHFMVEDPLVLESLVMLYAPPWSNSAMKGLQWFKRALTIGVTTDPTFRVRNLIRDSLSMVASNKIGFNPLKNLAQGWKATERGGDTYLRLLGGGGAIRFGSLLDGDQAAHAKSLIRAGLATDPMILNSPAKVKTALGKAWDAYQEFGDRAETVNRAALYEQARAAGRDHLEASFAARDTLDFTNAGAWTAVQFLTRTVPFMNARLQGLYKLGRGAKEDPKRFAAVAGAVAMASALLHLINADDEDYRALPDWVRDSYWWVRLPGTEHALYMPKPFELGALGSVVERGTELMTGGDDYQSKDFGSTLLSILSQQLSMNPTPQAFKPAIEAAFNRNTFQDRPIDGMGQERLPPGDRFTARTSGGAVALGQLTNTSPQRIEHMVRGYFGWLGLQALNVSDLMTRDLLDLGSNPARDYSKVDNLAVLGSFIRERDAGSSKYVNRFYDQQKQVDMLYGAYAAARQAGDLDRARELAKDDRLKLRGLYQVADREMTKLNRRIRQVTSNKRLSADAKGELLSGLYGTRDRLAERATVQARKAAK